MAPLAKKNHNNNNDKNDHVTHCLFGVLYYYHTYIYMYTDDRGDHSDARVCFFPPPTRGRRGGGLSVAATVVDDDERNGLKTDFYYLIL